MTINLKVFKYNDLYSKARKCCILHVAIQYNIIMVIRHWQLCKLKC